MAHMGYMVDIEGSQGPCYWPTVSTLEPRHKDFTTQRERIDLDAYSCQHRYQTYVVFLKKNNSMYTYRRGPENIRWQRADIRP